METKCLPTVFLFKCIVRSIFSRQIDIKHIYKYVIIYIAYLNSEDSICCEFIKCKQRLCMPQLTNIAESTFMLSNNNEIHVDYFYTLYLMCAYINTTKLNT